MHPACADGIGGKSLMLAATAIAAGLAEGKTEEDIAILAAFLNVVSDQLSLLAALRAARGNVPPAACPGGGGINPGPSC